MSEINIQRPQTRTPIVAENGIVDRQFLQFLIQMRTRTLNTLELVDAPASASASGQAGQVAYDNDYIYVCVDTDTWKRAGLSTW